LAARKILDTRIGQFNEKWASVERANANAGDLERELQTLKARQANQDYAQVVRESLVNIKAEIHKLDFEPVIYANLQAQIRSQRHVETRYQQIKPDLNELARVNEEYPKLKDEVEKLANQIDAEDYGSDERVNLKAILSEIENLKYDQSHHQKLKQKLT